MSSRHLEMANIHITFGDLNLLDLVQQVVLPAFLDGPRVREYGETDYYLLDTDLLELTAPNTGENGSEIALTGRLVKNTRLTRDQVLDPNRQALVRDHQEMDSAPSSVFLLLFGCHRVLFLPEVEHAPSLAQFRATITHFVKKQRLVFVDSLYQEGRHFRIVEGVDSDKPPTKKALYREVPPVHIELVPLTSGQDFAQFIDRFERLKSVELKLIHRNHEYDPNELFEAIDAEGEELGSDRSKLTHANARNGLNKDRTKESYKGHAERGNARVRLDGVDANGDHLTGNNEDFRLKVPFDQATNAVNEVAKHMYKAFVDLARNGTIDVPFVKTDRASKLAAVKRSRDERSG